MNLLGYRASAKKTQYECAQLIGKSTRTYASKERGETPFTVDEAILLCEYLNCPIEAFEQRNLIFLH